MDHESFLELVAAGDEQAVHKELEEEPTLARASTDQGISALMWALYNRQQATAAVVAEASDDLSLLELTALGREADVRAMLPDADLTTTSKDGFTALHFAAFFGHASLVRVLLDAGAPPGAVANNPMKVQPLHSAAAARSIESVEALLDAGAEVNAVQEQGFTALHAAAHAGDVAMGRLLLARGADADQRTDAGKSARDLAADGHHHGFLAILPG